LLYAVFGEAKKLSMAALSQTLRKPLYRADDAVIGYQSRELLAGVLAAAIGVMQTDR
jgi:hypothetical protein